MKKLCFSIFLLLLCAGAFVFLRNRQASKIATHIELSRTEKDAIIERALALELPTTNNEMPERVKKYAESMMGKVRESQYEEAIGITVAGLQEFPNNFELQSDLAALVGDTSEITDEPLKSKMLLKAESLFERLLKESETQSKETFYPFKNEYYFRNALYREQYELGIERVATYWGTAQWDEVGVKGYYCQGVGAARYAKALIEQGNKPLALAYAQKAIVAWAQYFSYKNDYYNAYVHYALALGILGYHEEMMHALLRSSSIIQRDLDYFEFKEITDFIAQMK